MHSGRADDPASLFPVLGQKACHCYTVENLNSKPFHFFIQCRLYLGGLNPDCVFAVIVVGKNQFCFFVPERSAHELIVNISYFYPHLFDIKKRIITLLGSYIG